MTRAAVTLAVVATMVTVLGLEEEMVMDKEEIYVPIWILPFSLSYTTTKGLLHLNKDGNRSLFVKKIIGLYKFLRLVTHALCCFRKASEVRGTSRECFFVC